MKELLRGYDEDPDNLFKTFEIEENEKDMVVVGNIPFYSLCEHHLTVFWGEAFVGYLPKDKTIGLSKIPRLIDVYSRRIQLQERLTKQVANKINEKLQPEGVIVVTKARHMCMESRGVCKPGTITTCSSIRGCFDDNAIRQEFLKLSGV
jgi:GTP cyclohydrolase I